MHIRIRVAAAAQRAALAATLALFRAAVSAAEAPQISAVETYRGTRAAVSWTGGDGAESFELRVFTTNFIPAAGETAASFSFDGFSNSGIGLSAEKTKAIIAACPALAGSTFLYLPAKSEGLVQLSKRTINGVLSCDVPGPREGLWLSAVLKRYEHEDETKIMAIGWEEPAGTTNFLSQTGPDGSLSPVYVPLEAEFTHKLVPLDGIPAGAKILLNPCKAGTQNKKTNHRIIFDRVDFILGYAPERTETNTVSLAECDGRVRRAWAGGLEQERRYLATVAALYADGSTTVSEPVEFDSGNGRPQPFMLTLR